MLEDARKQAEIDRLRTRRNQLDSERAVIDRRLNELETFTAHSATWREVNRQIDDLKLVL